MNSLELAIMVVGRNRTNLKYGNSFHAKEFKDSVKALNKIIVELKDEVSVDV